MMLWFSNFDDKSLVRISHLAGIIMTFFLFAHSKRQLIFKIIGLMINLFKNTMNIWIN